MGLDIFSGFGYNTLMDTKKGTEMMNFEERCLAIVADVTPIRAYFFQGTMFLETEDSKIATKVYSALSINNQSCGIVYGKAGQSETFYDFV